MLGGFILYFTASYPVTYLTVGALGVLTLVIVLLLPEVEPTRARETKAFGERFKQFRQGIAEVISEPPILIASSIEAVMYFGYAAFLGFLPIYAKRAGLNNAEIALVLGTQLIAAMLVKPLAGTFSDRLGRKRVIIVGLLFCIVALPLIFRSEGFAAFALTSAMLGIGVGAVTPVTNALIADLASVRRLGAAMGVFGTIFDFGEAMGPIVAGFLIGSMGFSATFDVLAAMTLAATVMLAFAVKEPKPVNDR